MDASPISVSALSVGYRINREFATIHGSIRCLSSKINPSE